MRILYLSCHAGLEWYEIPILLGTGAEVLSLGAYSLFENSNHYFPALPYDQSEEMQEVYHRFRDNVPLAVSHQGYLTPKFLDFFDIIVTMAYPSYLESDWEVLKGRRVVVRTIGQSGPEIERFFSSIRKDIKIVRYSPVERKISGCAGEDALIRFGVDFSQFGPWDGDKEKVLTICQSFRKRRDVCNFDVFDLATANLDRLAIGLENEDVPYGIYATPEEKSWHLSHSRVYVHCGTKPASYTLGFIEALATGIPVISIDSSLGGDLLETHQMIESNVNGFVSDDLNEINHTCHQLMKDQNWARQIGQNGRVLAQSLFDKEEKIAQWRSFLENLM